MVTQRSSKERGIALVMVMLLTVAVAALAAGAIFLTSSATLISRGQEREEEMRNHADGGIEVGRSALNGGSVTLPDTGYRTLYLDQPVVDANGVTVPGITRSIYYGPTGSSTGQYGIFGSVVSVITDRSGAVVVRRGELAQESFAKFAYYTDDEGSGICFGGGDNIFGPLHTNDDMCIYSSTARFRSTVEVSGTITGTGYGTFDQGYTERGAVIPLPSIADLARLSTYATTGGMNFTPNAGGTGLRPRMRIEFVSLDLDNDGRVTGPDEGFFRVYDDTGVTNTEPMVAARIAGADSSSNCGHYHNNTFFTAAQHRLTAPANANIFTVANPWDNTPNSRTHVGTGTAGTTSANESLSRNDSGGMFRCWLAGDEHLNLDTIAGGPIPRNTFRTGDRYGAWRQYTATPNAAVIAGLKNTASLTVDTSLANRTIQARYLYPISRAFNPNSKGVIYVNGVVGLSGVLNGRITLAASGEIVILDDIRYATAPGSAPCLSSNILGLLSPDSMYISDNTINAPWNTSGTYQTYDDTGDETIQGVLLTLKSFGVENHNSGSTSAQPCQGTNWGRGCIFLTGGIIQDTRGAVGLGSGEGYLKRYAYDICAYQTPPPYFPTTGRFARNRYYEIDPVGFNVSRFFEDLAPRY